MNGAPGGITSVLLPDGQWYKVDPGSYVTRAAKDGGRFEFRQLDATYRGPQSSVLATMENTGTSSNGA